MKRARVSLQTVHISGFRSCDQTAFALNNQLSVLIGPNGSGKTNILQAIMMLGEWSRPHRYLRSNDPATSSCRLQAEFELKNKITSLRSTLNFSLNEENREDVVDAHDEWKPEALNEKASKDHPWGYVHPEFLYHYGRASKTLRQMAYTARKNIRMARHPSVRRPSMDPYVLPNWADKQQIDRLVQILEFRNRISYYSASQFTNPSRCPGFIEIDEDRDLVRPASIRREHQRFLFDMYLLRQTNPDKYSSYLSLVGKHGLQLIDNIYWKEVPVSSSVVDVQSGGRVVKRNRQRMLLVPSAKVGSERLSFSQLSEGTFKTIALVFYITTDKSDLLLIEEPEVCVHYGLLASIVELIKSQSLEKQIVVSTHSDFVLDRVKPEQVFSVRKYKKKGTIVRPLSTGYPRETIQALREHLQYSGNLGEFWRQGGLDD